MSKVLLCSACKLVVPSEAGLRPKSFPFCSERCRMLDLSHWLQGEYTLPQPIGPDDHEAINDVLRHQLPEG
jgi:endogenous inhibitor of DNA gyrase (YacG/DUF329 family)